MSTLEELQTAVEKGKRKVAVPLVSQALDEGISAQTILNDALVAAMDVVGEKFSRNEVFVPEMLVAARTMGMCTDVLKPYLAQEGTEPLGKGVIATVQGDMHDIGKNLVRLMLEGKGFEMDDLGVDVPPEKVVEYIQSNPEVRLFAYHDASSARGHGQGYKGRRPRRGACHLHRRRSRVAGALR